MNGLCVVGAGGHGTVVADAARESGEWTDIIFFDDGLPRGATVGTWQVVGRSEEVGDFRDTHPNLVVAFGDNRNRAARLRAFAALGFELPCIVHPRAYVSEHAVLERGSVVLAQAAVNFGASVGEGGIVNTGASVDHDCKLGSGVHICPGARLAGSVSIGDHVWVGIGASIIQGIVVGADAVIGAGAAVVSEVGTGQTVVGVPARPVPRVEQGV